MPPANSPTDTPAPRPQPPVSRPYLQQLETISNLVPNFAESRGSAARDELPDRNSMSDLRSAISQAAPLSRSTRNIRAPYLTEDEFRAFTTASRRRVQNNLAMDGGAGAPSIHSYSNRTPSRESLYDWAAAAEDSDGEENGESNTAEPSVWQQDAGEQQRAMSSWISRNPLWWREEQQRQRESRRPLEPRDEPSGRVRLQLVRNRSPSADEREDQIARLTAAGRSPSVTQALSRLIERQRVERRERRWEREHFAEAGRNDDQSSRVAARARALRELRSRERFAHYLDSRHRLKPPSMPKTVNIIKYLSALRGYDDVSDALSLAAALGLPTLFSSPSSTTPSDLMLSASHLSSPCHSSFLTSGTVFEGVQQTPQQPPTVLLNRDRDYLRRMVANRNLNFSSTNLPGSLAALMDAERYVVDLLQDETDSSPNGTSARTQDLHTRDARWRSPNVSRSTPPQPSQPIDSWPVRVTLHSVCLESMTLNGTMSASHIPDKLSPSSPDHKPDGCSMESFFEGEIIDFTKFSLETGNERFKSGGIEVDARHWRGIGPFREAAEQVKRRKFEAKVAMSGGITTAADTRSESKGRYGLTYDEEEELEVEIDEEIAKCLGSRKWMEEKLGEKWVLMRWKERCFVNLPPGTSASDRYGNTLPGLLATASAVTSTSAQSGCYGLTISGFYYIALHRQTGAIEGLYYDPGSQPYQELRLLPEGCRDAKWADNVRDQEMAGRSDASVLDNGDADDTSTGGRGFSTGDPMVGVKRWFPSVEFR